MRCTNERDRYGMVASCLAFVFDAVAQFAAAFPFWSPPNRDPRCPDVVVVGDNRIGMVRATRPFAEIDLDIPVSRWNWTSSTYGAFSREVVGSIVAVSYTHLRAHETDSYLVCRLLL